MEETIFATYERQSTLWKNANAFYVSQDWTKMECYFVDYSEDRKTFEEMGMRTVNKKTGEDITEQFIEENYSDCYCVRLTNKRRTNFKVWRFKTKEEANAFFKEVYNHKRINGWKKVS